MRHPAFTLSELLVSLAILGVIAAFTIPKLLVTQQNAKYNTPAKQAAGMVSSAYQTLKLNGGLSASTSPAKLTPYLNYVAYDTSSTLDGEPGYTTWTCAANAPCIRLHNGAMMKMRQYSFAGTASTNTISFFCDPDGVADGTTNGPGKSVLFLLNYNGLLQTKGQILAGSTDSSGNTYSTNANELPSWFSW